MMKNDTTVSENQCAPDAIRDTETATAYPMPTADATRLRLEARTNARPKNAPAASPDENERLWLHSETISKAGVKWRVPPNSTTSRGRARPKFSLRSPLT